MNLAIMLAQMLLAMIMVSMPSVVKPMLVMTVTVKCGASLFAVVSFYSMLSVLSNFLENRLDVRFALWAVPDMSQHGTFVSLLGCYWAFAVFAFSLRSGGESYSRETEDGHHGENIASHDDPPLLYYVLR